MMCDVNDSSIEAVLHRLCNIGSAEADFSARQVANAVAYPKRAMHAFHLWVALDFPYCLERPVGIARHAGFHWHIYCQREYGRIKENLLRLKGVLVDCLVKNLSCQGKQLINRMRTTGADGRLFADQKADERIVEMLL